MGLKGTFLVASAVLLGASLGSSALLLARSSAKEVRIIATSARPRVRRCGCQAAREVDRPGISSEGVPEPGGLAEKSAWLARTRARDGELVELDAGDLLFPTREPLTHEPAEWRRRAELLVEAYGLLGVRAYVPGERDLALGRKAFLEILGRAKFKVIAANLVDATTRKPLFPGHVVIEAGGARIGVIGIYDPPYQADVNRKLLAKEGLASLDLVQALRSEVAAVRAEGVDLVVLLAHQAEEATRILVKSVNGVDTSQQNDNVDIAFCAHAEVPSDTTTPYEGTTRVCAAHWHGGDLDYAHIRLVPGGKGSVDPAVVAAAIKARDERSRERAALEAERERTQDDGARRILERKIERAAALVLDAERAIPRQPRHEATIESVTLDARKLKEGQDPAILEATERFKKDLGELKLDPAMVAELEATRHAKEGYLLGYRTAMDCTPCHAKQNEVWKTSAHARAWASLESAGNDRDPDCVRCHSVGFREPGGFAEVSRFLRTEGKAKLDFRNVQCESCHGPRLDHPDQKGFWRMPTLATCQACHDSEHDGSFDQARMTAALTGEKRVCVRD